MFEDEGLVVDLVVENVSREPVDFPPGFAYVLASDDGLALCSLDIDGFPPALPSPLRPGERLRAPLERYDATRGARRLTLELWETGWDALRCDKLFRRTSITSAYRVRDLRPRGEPFVTTPPLTFTCSEQPLELPEGTLPEVRTLLEAARRAAPPKIEVHEGFAVLADSEELPSLKRIGPPAVPALIAALHHHRLQLLAAEVLGRLRVRSAVPALVRALRLDHTYRDAVLLRAVCAIAGHEEWVFTGHARVLPRIRDWWAKHGDGNELSPPRGRR
ncbi:MAG: hypothetical protein AB7N76_35805 [Planctomycetota bacterium]